ncbi:MAG: TetR family transcriptional regulator [Candidatus Dormiibacterota bacterium]
MTDTDRLEAPTVGAVPETHHLRADARRNRDRLVTVAAAVFAEKGVDAPLEEIARRAEVGIGTLYRHFPTRLDLVGAIYLDEVDALCGRADELLAQEEPLEALRAWLERWVQYVATKRGLARALQELRESQPDVLGSTHHRILSALQSLLRAAEAQGQVRPNVDPNDVLRALGGICMYGERMVDVEQTMRILDLLVDGLRYGAVVEA